MSRPLRVFLCHASDDKLTVRDLYQRLDSEGWIDAWLDEEKLFPGQDWNYEIEKAVEEADVIIICLTKNSVTKEGFVQRELRIILDFADYKPEGTLYIIPVRLEECEPPKRVRRWQYADYFPENNRKIAYQRLLGSLKFRANRLGISTIREIRDEIEETLDQSQFATLTADVQQMEEYRSHPSIPPRSASVLGARTSATPAALDAKLTVLQGVGSTRADSLARLGLYTLRDMLYFYPQRYSMEAKDKNTNRILPIYSLTDDITQKWLRQLMEQVVEYWAPNVADALPESVRLSAGLMPLNEALLQVHFPKAQEMLRAARERLVFEEIFYLQMIVLRQKREWNSETAKRFSLTDIKLIEKARSEAQRLFDEDSELSRPEHSLLAEVLESFWAVGRQHAG